MISARHATVETLYDEQTLEAATKRFRGGIGLQELLLEAAWANGYTGCNFRDGRSVLRFAFGQTLDTPLQAQLADRCAIAAASPASAYRSGTPWAFTAHPETGHLCRGIMRCDAGCMQARGGCVQGLSVVRPSLPSSGLEGSPRVGTGFRLSPE